MSRFWVSSVSIMVLSLGLFVLLGTVPAHANPYYRLDATSQYVNGFTDFFLVWEDTNPDGLLQIDEVRSFSGVKYKGSGAPDWVTYTSVEDIPVHSLDPLTYSQFTDGQQGYQWYFALPTTPGAPSHVYPAPVVFTYARSPVPLPPSALLLVSGLIPLAWARRKKRGK